MIAMPKTLTDLRDFAVAGYSQQYVSDYCEGFNACWEILSDKLEKQEQGLKAALQFIDDCIEQRRDSGLSHFAKVVREGIEL